MNIYCIIIAWTIKHGEETGHGWVISKEEGIFTDNSNRLIYAGKVSQKIYQIVLTLLVGMLPLHPAYS